MFLHASPAVSENTGSFGSTVISHSVNYRWRRSWRGKRSFPCEWLTHQITQTQLRSLQINSRDNHDCVTMRLKKIPNRWHHLSLFVLKLCALLVSLSITRLTSPLRHFILCPSSQVAFITKSPLFCFVWKNREDVVPLFWFKHTSR